MIIGLTGHAFAGKDTVGTYLAHHHGFTAMSFADPIRAGITAMFGLPKSCFLPENKERVIDWIGKSPRELMQLLGTEFGRDLISQSIWMDTLSRRITAFSAALHGAIVITDVRFPNEADLITRLGGQVWRIVRPEYATTSHCGHASEQQQDKITPRITLINDGTLEMLYEQIDDALEMV